MSLFKFCFTLLLDLKAFERRLTEMISCIQPQTKRWRIVLFTSSICTSIGAFQWLMDPLTSQITLLQSLLNHLFFTINCIILIALFFIGIHKKVVAPQMYVCHFIHQLADTALHTSCI